jgi:Tfp pilus assembly protein PilO
MKRRHNAKFWLLMAALGFVGGAALVGFQFSNLNADKARVDQLQSQTQNESEVQAQLTKSQQDLEESKARLTHLEQGIPSTAYIPTMLQELAKTGNESGIRVTGVRPVPRAVAAAAGAGDGSQAVAKPAYDELSIEVKGRGTYASAMKFITALQTFPKIVGSRTIDISPCLEPKDAKDGLVDINVGLRAYLFPDNKDRNKATKTRQVNNSSEAKGKEAAA